MPFTTATICDNTAATTNGRTGIDWNSYFSLTQQDHHISAIAAAMALQSFPSSLPFTLYGEIDRHLFQIRSSTAANNDVDRLIAVLDAALEIVKESDIHSRDNESSIVDDESSSQTRRDVGHSKCINDRGQGRKTSQGDRSQ
jgi:hypothetical protein